MLYLEQRKFQFIKKIPIESWVINEPKKRNINILNSYKKHNLDVNFFLKLIGRALISFVKFYFCNHEDNGTNIIVCFYNFSCHSNCY